MLITLVLNGDFFVAAAVAPLKRKVYQTCGASLSFLRLTIKEWEKFEMTTKGRIKLVDTPWLKNDTNDVGSIDL